MGKSRFCDDIHCDASFTEARAANRANQRFEFARIRAPIRKKFAMTVATGAGSAEWERRFVQDMLAEQCGWSPSAMRVGHDAKASAVRARI
jgi:hypothetical protein